MMDIEEVSQDSGLESPTSKGDTPERQMHNPFMSETIPLLLNPDVPAPAAPSVPSAASAPSNDSSKAAQISNFNPDDSESYDDEPDETLGERLWGLTEMFPECVANATYTITTNTMTGIKHLYSFSRSALWIAASSCVILMAPVFFELEIAKIEESKKSEQKQYLLGPNAAMVGPNAAPPMPR